MAMVVKNNIEAQNTLNTLNKNANDVNKDLKKVASGMRINGAGDDASGYSISERMATQIRGLEQDNVNAQNGSSMLKVADGALQSTVEALRSLKEKAINAANDTNTDGDRLTIQKEMDQVIDQLEENALVTYNGQYLIDGSKNSYVSAETRTHLTNDSLSDETYRDSRFLDLKDPNGNPLGITTLDTITVSYVKEGVTYVRSVRLEDWPNDDITFENIGNYLEPQTLDGRTFFDDFEVEGALSTDGAADPTYIGLDQYGDEVHTIDGRHAITYRAKEPGLNGQIAGLTICVTDHYGNPNKYANELLDNFKETIVGQDPSEDNSVYLQIGTKANQSVHVGLMDMRSRALGLRGKDGDTLSIATRDYANAAVNVLDNALQKALNQQTTLGSMESRLEFTSANIVVASENTQAAQSVIRDADMAKEMTEYTRHNVLLQAAQSMLSQANQNSSQVLSLLQ